MSDRYCEYTRTTSETSITVSLNLDGSGVVNVDTGMGFADHMFTLLAFWAGFDLALSCSGDLEVDGHHSLEDIGLCLGHCLKECLGDKKGIQRVGWSRVPMDEALAEVTIDLSGRPYIVYQGDTLPATIAGQETDVWREFFKSLAFSGAFNLHIDFKYGLNGHHLLESAFKGLGLALRQAVSFRDVQGGVLSTKGSLDQ